MSSLKREESVSTTMSGTGTAAKPALTNHGIWVAVRVRPFNKRELATEPGKEEAAPVVDLERDRKTMTLLDPQKNYKERSNFVFDYCFSAFNTAIEFDGDRKKNLDDSDDDDEEAEAERAQMQVYNAVGQPIVAAAWAGYNGCIFAYGQTSSGKTYTMMGTKRDPGLIPRLCRELFEKIEDDDVSRAKNQEHQAGGGDLGEDQKQSIKKVTKCTVSYMEIYNEKVKDLLKVAPKGQQPKFNSRFDNNAAGGDGDYQNLRVRQHPLHGPFVEGLTKHDVNNWLDCVRIIRQGNEARTTHATSLNDSSSRSHAIFQIVVTQTEALGAKVRGKEVTNHRVSKINLVDLAGSERISQSNVTGKHATEANCINQSLTTLRKVIGALVEQAKKKAGGGKPLVIPYRESMLTWVLSDNFGGNSKTAMIANVSPHSSCFLETESTLRYATLAKGIVNRIRVNEDPSTKLIRELQAQLKAMQAEMSHGPQGERVKELEDQMEENRRAMEELQAREEGMRKLIQESRAREATLRSEKDQWKAEAEKLEKEKEDLKKQLAIMATTGGGSPSAKDAARGAAAESNDKGESSQKEVDFWNTDDIADKNLASDADVSCPPQRRQSARWRPPAETTTTSANNGETKEETPAFLMSEDSPKNKKQSTAPEKSTSNQDLPVLANSTASMNLVTSPTESEPIAQEPPSSSVSPAARYGRRAATEEGKDREPLNKSQLAPSQVRTAEQGRRSRSEVPPPAGGAVPMSLQHLVAGGSSSGSRSQVQAQPDALDAFLSGGTTTGQASVANKKERAVPPWRQKRGTA